MPSRQNKLAINTKLKKNHFLSASKKENLKIYWYKFSQNKLSIIGLILVLLSIFIAIFAPVIAPFPQHVKEFVEFKDASLPPSSTHPFGTDIFGRDILSRVIFSFRGALIMSIIVLGIATPVGVTLGLVAGYYKNSVIGNIIMRITDIFLALPKLVLALAIAAVLEPNLTNSILALCLVWWTWYTRIVYGMSVALREEYFVKSAELIGASKIHILFREILPSCLPPIITKMALDVGWIILLGATLSFVGLGAQPPAPSFGQLVADGSSYMPDLWWMTIFPAIGIAFIIMGFNFFGDGIRDLLDRGK
jgi:peptide/nickel transport system permease protein